MPSRPVAAFAALLFLLAGCAERTQGAPTAVDTPTSQEETTEPTETETSEPPSDGLAGIEPCDLLDDGELATLQLTGGDPSTIGSARACRWNRQGATIEESYTVSVELFDEQSLTDLNAPTVQAIANIGDHEAATFIGTTGTCGVSLGVGSSSRVDNTALGSDQQQACELATELAKIVEPKLP